MPKSDAATARYHFVTEWLKKRNLVINDPDCSVTLLAKTLMNTFLMFKQLDVPTYNLSDEYKSLTFWLYVATKVIDHQADPYLFIEIVYTHSGSLFRPALLAGNACWDWYVSEVNNKEIQNKIENELALSAIRYKNDCEIFNDPIKALENPNGSHNPLFKWCIAVRLNNEELKNKYKTAAKAFYIRPLYRNLYTKYFPEVFSQCQP